MIEEESPDCITESVDEGKTNLVSWTFRSDTQRNFGQKFLNELHHTAASVGNIFVAQRSTVNVWGSNVETTNSWTERVRPKAIASFCMSSSWILISKSSGNNLRQCCPFALVIYIYLLPFWNQMNDFDIQQMKKNIYRENDI